MGGLGIILIGGCFGGIICLVLVLLVVVPELVFVLLFILTLISVSILAVVLFLLFVIFLIVVLFFIFLQIPRPVGNDLIIENTKSKAKLLSYVDSIIEKLISLK